MGRAYDFSISGTTRLALHEVRSRLWLELQMMRENSVALSWDFPAWDDSVRAAQVSCTTDEELNSDLLLSAVAVAVSRVIPGSEATVRLSRAGVVVSPRVSDLSNVERPGWYLSLLDLDIQGLRNEPAAVAYVREHLTNMRRFRNASIAFDVDRGVGTIALETFGISPAAADGEVRDAIENLIFEVLEEPGEFSIKTLQVQFLRPDS